MRGSALRQVSHTPSPLFSRIAPQKAQRGGKKKSRTKSLKLISDLSGQTSAQPAVPARFAAVFDHGLHDRRFADNDKKLSRARDGGIEKIAAQKPCRGSSRCQNNGAVLAALRLVHRDGEGMIQLAELFKAIPCELFVKVDPDKLVFGVDTQYRPKIAVKDARAGLGERSREPFLRL